VGSCAANRRTAQTRRLAQISDLAPERFVYVSCNPKTQARDIQRLRDTYRIDAVQPVDMFPHTPHVENVVRLVSTGED
jgi:23S rRNA (uracil1939-C5)-methyltransferase